jgi:DNA-binding response OmpR family regulator
MPRRAAGYVRITGTALAFAEERGRPPFETGFESFEWDDGEAPGEQRLRGVKGGAGRRVLVVDDEPSMRLLCTINLELAGFEVVEAADGAQALEQARAGVFDLVLLDVMLPDIGGHEVARGLKADARTKTLPVVFLSARTDRDDMRTGFELGAIDYITKPFDPVLLAVRVEEILARVEREESESYRRARLAELGG